MGKNSRAFSLYDIEQFLRDAGAEKVSEKAVLSLEEELANTVKELVGEAQVYANYAGRSTLIKKSDIKLANGKKRLVVQRMAKKRVVKAKVGGPRPSALNVSMHRHYL